jgi:hypothetical protein
MKNFAGVATGELLRVENGVERGNVDWRHEISGRFFFQLDAQVGDFFAQCVAIDAEDLGRADLIALGFFEG